MGQKKSRFYHTSNISALIVNCTIFIHLIIPYCRQGNELVLALTMVQENFRREDVQNLPFGVSLPFVHALQNLSNTISLHPSDISSEEIKFISNLLDLIGRSDLAAEITNRSFR